MTKTSLKPIVRPKKANVKPRIAKAVEQFAYRVTVKPGIYRGVKPADRPLVDGKMYDLDVRCVRYSITHEFGDRQDDGLISRLSNYINNILEDNGGATVQITIPRK